VFLAWQVSGYKENGIPNCLGFAIERQASGGQPVALLNLKGFSKPKSGDAPSQPSTTWPFQAYFWTDHAAIAGTKVRYRIVAMLEPATAPVSGEASDWSDWIQLTAQADANTSAFFNRGLVLSQFVARFALQHQLKTPKDLKTYFAQNPTDPMLEFIAGELGKAIRGILSEAKLNPSIEIYCALFELDLDDIIEDLIAIGNRAHVILANGSVKTKGQDENAAAAERLQGKVDFHRRMTAPGPLAHNKFVAVTMNGKPFGILTGSTNWTLTGFHTQINNAIAIQDAALCQTYLDQWNLILQSGNTFPATLRQSNAKEKGPFPIVAPSEANVWFTPLPKASPPGADMPGPEPLNSILKRQDGGLFVRGVISTEPLGNKKTGLSQTAQIINDQAHKPYQFDVVQPEGLNQPIGPWIQTYTRSAFLSPGSGIGFAITHSKVIVIDPFGDDPIVVTGSHNLSGSASSKNDENLIIIRNSPGLARAYAVHCMTIYQHYRWPAYQDEVSKNKSSDDGFLDKTPGWQAKAQTPDTLNALKFWLG
jgi:hypothetical protein